MDILVLASTCLVLMFLLGIMVGAAWSSYRIHKGLNPPPLSTQPSNLTIQPGDFVLRFPKKSFGKLGPSACLIALLSKRRKLGLKFTYAILKNG